MKYLLGKHSGYHKWVLPKGMIEAGETPEETAVREVKEEMGVEARIVRKEPLHLEVYTFMADYKDPLC
jgi:8-oxo-dGTP pyrophosphatase MutT (NUDIX family)